MDSDDISNESTVISSLSLVYDPYMHVPISYGVGDIFWQCSVTMDSDDISKESTVIFIIEFGI